MAIKAILKKFLLWELAQGLSITFRTMCTKAVTEQYPKQRSHIFDRFRGMPRMMKDEAGSSLCIACGLCENICPEKCIKVEKERDPETKKFTLKGYTFDMRRCLFCGFCQEVCPTKAVVLTRDYEMSRYDKDDFVLDLETLEKGMEIKQYKK